MNKQVDFIYLVPGNWFELKNINKDKVCPFDIDMLKEEILNQVNDRSEKLSFVNIEFGSAYGKNTIEDIEFHLDKNKFNQMAKLLITEKRHPIITFHGTSLDSVKSILANGYIIPGVDKSNVIVTKTHGSAYGIGIYTSPFFGKAMHYTNPDNAKYVYILINMVLPGILKLIPQIMNMVDMKAPVNGCYFDGANTRIVYGLEQLVSADSSRVIPVAVMKINIG